MNNIYKPDLFILIFLLITSCGQQNQQSEKDQITNAFTLSVEAAINSIGSTADEQNGEEIAMIEDNKFKDFLNFLNPIQAAYAATCSGRAFHHNCESGKRSIRYYDCELPYSSHELAGEVILSYSDSSTCRLLNEQDYVIRSFDMTKTLSNGVEIYIFSNYNEDYEGEIYGGGGKITKVAEGLELEILGKHKESLKDNGEKRFSLSIRTTSPISLSDLDRSNRIVDGGNIVVAHNLAQFKVELAPNNVAYTSNCCHPVSGSIGLTYSGSINGEGVVSFNGCGSATLTKGDLSQEIELNSCE